jgi:hypothetical protein
VQNSEQSWNYGDLSVADRAKKRKPEIMGQRPKSVRFQKNRKNLLDRQIPRADNSKRPASTFSSDWATEEGCKPVFSLIRHSDGFAGEVGQFPCVRFPVYHAVSPKSMVRNGGYITLRTAHFPLGFNQSRAYISGGMPLE